MKLLFSHYRFLINELSELAYELGFRGNLSLQICQFTKVKSHPIHPTRSVISTKDMKILLHCVQDCYNDLFFFVKVLGI